MKLPGKGKRLNFGAFADVGAERDGVSAHLAITQRENESSPRCLDLRSRRHGMGAQGRRPRLTA